jgi:5-methylcytosine-specific restriction endonuclease McrA
MAMTREERLAKKRARYQANRERNLAYAAEYRATNPDKVRAAQKSWYDRNQEHAKASSRKNYHENRERYLEQMAKWRAENREIYRQHALKRYYQDVEAGRTRCREYRARDVEKHRARLREWIKQNPERMRDSGRRRRARMYEAAVESIQEREVFDRDGWCCYICGDPVVQDVPTGTLNKAVVEHVIPLSKGGTHTSDNVRCACHRCNSIKGRWLTPDQVRERLANENISTATRLRQ